MPLRKVKMLTGLAGAKVIQAGEVVSLPAEVAARYVEKGIAEYVDKPEGVKPSAPPVKRARKARSTKVKQSEKR